MTNPIPAELWIISHFDLWPAPIFLVLNLIFLPLAFKKLRNIKNSYLNPSYSRLSILLIYLIIFDLLLSQLEALAIITAHVMYYQNLGR
jgi:hypothetical protein